VNNQRKLKKIMENKEIIIIALVVIAIYLYCRYYGHLKSYNGHLRFDLNRLDEQKGQLEELTNQLQHYQTLYQKRVEKDLDAETLNSE